MRGGFPLFGLAWFFVHTIVLTISAFAFPGDLDPSFGNGGKITTHFDGSYDLGTSVVLLDDGKILVGGGEGFKLARYLPTGSLDVTFGNGGKVIDGSTNGSGSDMKLQRDGKIILAGVVGFPSNVRVSRYSTNGAVDATFGSAGSTIIDFGDDDLAIAMKLASDGKIVIVGYSGRNESGNIILARLNANGSLDTSFGNGGRVTTDIAGKEDMANAAAILGNGKILVAGSTFGSNRDFALLRYEANGSLDQTFGVGGKVISPVGASDEVAYALTVQPDGKMIIAGSSQISNHYHVTMIRYHPDGAVDNDFGTGGSVITQTGSYRSSVARDLAIQGDGKILVAAALDQFQEDFLVLRYHENGTLDQSFGVGGRVQTLFGGSTELPWEVALQRDGKIVVAGYSYQSQTGYDFAVVRYLGDGPSGGAFSITPPSPAPAGAPMTANFSNWSAVTLPLTYELRSGANIIVPAGSNPAPQFELAPGTYQLKGRIYDGAGNFSETAAINLQVAEGPVASTHAATEVMTYSAKLNGSVDPNSLPTQVSWLYGTAMPLTAETSAQTVNGANPVPVLQTVSGLQPGTQYFFQMRAVNSITESRGDIATFTTASADATHTILHATREAVPFAGSAGIPQGATWSYFGVPSLLGAGDSLGFSATIRKGASTIHGVFSGPLQAPALRVKTGDPATDPNGTTVGGVVFAQFKAPVFAAPERWAVLATVAGSAVTSHNDTGVWAGEPGGIIREVAREGSVAPGTFGATFKSFTSVLRHDPKWLAFTAKLAGPGVSRENDCGLWMWSPNTGTVLYTREGANNLLTLDRMPIKRFKALEAVPGSPGQGRHDRQFLGGIVTAVNGEQAIVNFASQQVQSHVRTGAVLPGGITAVRFGWPCWLPGGESYSVLATLLPDGTAVTPASRQAVLRDGFIAAQRGATVPGIEGARYRGFNDPVADFARDGEPYTVFMASMSGAGIDSSNDRALFGVIGASGTPELIAREGDEPPGTPGAKWKRFTSVSVLSGRGALFTGTFAPDKPTRPSGSGVWGEDSSGALQLLFREGSMINGRKVRAFTILSTVAGSPAQRRSWVQGTRTLRPASVISRVAFTDGTSAIVTTSIP